MTAENGAESGVTQYLGILKGPGSRINLVFAEDPVLLGQEVEKVKAHIRDDLGYPSYQWGDKISLYAGLRSLTEEELSQITTLTDGVQ